MTGSGNPASGVPVPAPPGKGTIPLHYLEPLVDRYRSTVLEARPAAPESVDLVLDATLFYPEGGGQPCDLGTIAGHPVRSVRLEKDTIVHRMDSSCGLAVGDAVDLVLDRERRDDHAEQHSAQHLLSAIAYARYGAVTKSFHLGQDRSTIDLDIHPFTPEMVRDCEEAANRMVGERRPVRVHRCPPGDIQSLNLRLRKPPPESEAVLRIVEIEEVDASPCCGTHVRSTLELRLLRIVSAEKYKGMTRIAFVAGNRAVRESTLRSLALDQAARSLGVAWQEVGDRIAGMNARIASLRENLDALGAWKTRRLAQAAVEAWRKDGSPAILAGEDAATDVDAAMDFVRTCFRAEVPAVAVVPGALTVCVALPASVRVDPGIRAPAAVGEELSILAKSLGARGGGPPTGFRATFGSPVAMDAFILELRRRLAPESRTAADPPPTP